MKNLKIFVTKDDLLHKRNVCKILLYLTIIIKNDNVVSQLINVIDDLCLITLNNGNATRLQRPLQNKSVVDISLCSTDLANNITWNTCQDTLGSDHFPIVLEISLHYKKNNIIFPKAKWNLNKANWPLYSSLIEQKFDNQPLLTNSNDKYKFLMDSINSAAPLSMPTYKPFKCKSRLPPPWWNETCDQAISERKQAIQNYTRNPTEENYFYCKKICAITKRTLKNIAKQSWINWCSNLNKNTPSSELWKQAKKMQRIPSSQKTTDDYNWIDGFFDRVAPPSANNLAYTQNTSSTNNHFLCLPFQYNELESALKM